MDEQEKVLNARQEMDQLVLDSLKGRKIKPNVVFAKLSDLSKVMSKGVVHWSRVNSVWPLQFGLACCAMELMDFGSARIDAERKGFLLFRATPRQADVMLVAGWVTKSMIPEIKRLYEQMSKPRYVIAFGECATCGGPWWESYNILSIRILTAANLINIINNEIMTAFIINQNIPGNHGPVHPPKNNIAIKSEPMNILV